MKKTIFICLTMVIVLVAGSSAIAAGKGKAACLTDPPANFECLIDSSAETVFCSWEALPGANKYAFEVLFEIPLLDDPNATHEVDFEAGTTDTNITVTFIELQTVLDPFGVTLSGQLATAKVKGLNPPKKRACSQANTFAETGLDFSTPDL